MDDARRREQWVHTSQIAATIENWAAFRTGKPASPDKYNPFKQSAQAAGKPLEAPVRMPFKTFIALMVKTKPRPKKKPTPAPSPSPAPTPKKPIPRGSN